MLKKVIAALEERMPGFEVRQSQLTMMERTYESMKRETKLAVHAPTGTGKSLGYLIPYIAVKLENPAFRMIVSTYTLHLQEQVKKDLEIVNDIYVSMQTKGKPKDLRLVTWKGKSNYFCADNAQRNRARIDPQDQPAYLSLVGAASRQLERHERLDRQHLHISAPESVWRQVHTTICQKDACQHHKRCTYISDYGADNIDLLVLNHALYFNLWLFVGPFEDYQFTVFDEAHHLEKVVIESATMELSIDTVRYWVEEAGRILRAHDEAEATIQSFETNFLGRTPVLRLAQMTETMKTKMTTPTVTFVSPLFCDMVGELSAWQDAMYESLPVLLESKLVDEEEKERFSEARSQWFMALSELKEFKTLLDHPTAVCWAERDQERVTFRVSPNSLDFFEQSLFLDGALFTSGTLSQGGSCQDFTNRLRLPDCEQLVLPTPFDLPRRTLVYVSPNIDPKQPTYEEDLESEIWQLLQAGDLKSFVLFSSLKLMRELHRRISFRLNNLDPAIECWIQDKNNKDQVIDAFMDNTKRTVLFGSLTFFEGVDLRGDALTQVIIARVPFAAPDHPIQNILNERGPYSFWEARMRLEQAYGRLIRAEKDYGSFAVLDRRAPHFKGMLDLFRTSGVPVVSKIEQVSDFHSRLVSLSSQ